MKTFAGLDAAQAFADLIKSLKEDHLLWCAVVVTWQGEETAPWLHDAREFLLLEQVLRKAVGKEADKCTLLALPSGALLLAAEKISNAGYHHAEEALQKTVEALPATCTAYDLSATWDAFFEACKGIYKPGSGSVAAKGRDIAALKQRLEERMVRSEPLFKQRNLKARKLILLFVEDEPSIRQLLTTLLSHENFHLRFAANGEEALLSYADLPPHLVFLDIQLPDFSGLEVLDIISRHDKDAYAVMLTGNAGKDDVTFARERGIKGYIVKPFSWQKLTECLQRYHQVRAA